MINFISFHKAAAAMGVGLSGNVAIQNIHWIIQSVGATDGVYKGQGRNQQKLMIHTYQELLVDGQ